MLALCVSPAFVSRLRAESITVNQTWTPRNSPAPMTYAGSRHNVVVIVTEDFANCIVARSDSQTSGVRDFILGADVVGCQQTNTNVRVDFLPRANCAELNLVLTGITNSNTVGMTSQARVNTLGNHRFQAVKRIYFDGIRITTLQPDAYVAANNQTVGATTQFSGVPLIGRIADQIAMNRAQEMRPQSQNIAAQKLAQRVVPEFNERIDTQLATLNRQLRTSVHQRLASLGVQISSRAVSSTDRDLSIAAFVGPPELAESLPPQPALQMGQKLTVAIHESALNNLIDEVGLAGISLTDQQLRGFGERLGDLLGSGTGDPAGPQLSDPSTADAAPLATITFEDVDPLRVRIDDNRLEVRIRAKLKPTSVETSMPMEITIPLLLNSDATQLVIEPGSIDIKTQPDPNSSIPPERIADVIRAQIESQFKPIRLNRSFKLPLETAQPVSLHVRHLVAEDGWFAASID